MRVLLVEDDVSLGEGMQDGLALEGYGVDWVRDARSAHVALVQEEYDLCILDLGLPDRDGLQVLSELRRRGDATPVLILTARDSVEDRVRGLDLGADDYVVKPVHLLELQARVRALLRRVAGDPSAQLRAGDLTLDPATKHVTLSGAPVTLSVREFALLQDLMMHKGRPRTRHALESSLYAWGQEVESNTVEVYVHHLRKKLGADRIRTVRGFGYVLEEPA